MLKFIKQCRNWIMLMLGVHSEVTHKAVDENVCDFSGQGRDSYGK